MFNGEISQVEYYKSNFLTEYIYISVLKYVFTLKEFIDLAYKSKYKTNKGFQMYTYIKGIESLHHVFMICMLYTCNIDLVSHTLQKSYYYYIEFIDQINKDEHYLLKFNIHDAILFVYKKSIYEIDYTYIQNIKHNANTKKNINILREITESINELLIHIIQHINDDKCKSTENINEALITMIKRVLQKKIHFDIDTMKNEYIECINDSLVYTLNSMFV